MSIREHRRTLILGAISAAFIVAFVTLPPLLAAAWTGTALTDHGQLVRATQQAFADYWRAGGGELDAGMQRLVDYWFAFHVVKGAFAALLLGALVALAVPLWRKSRLAAAGISALAFVAVAAVMANVQGILAPLSSLLPMAGEPALAQAGRELGAALSAGGPLPASVEPLVSDFGWYHAVMVPIAGVMVLFLLGASVLLWRRSKRAAALPVALALAMGAVVFANATTAADPAPALLAFFQGGW
ncbi:hypothetical protein [Paractinoplanes lichenicola]|uniref:Uncharacterized protein n=1 Tax=Paractinoplanes lichenicola TaxID=2802976 RepID=A0ABS1VZ09_9ACTN|nr:hypothetical protein [Actinoplanes lichenicola]MBL7259690.1 hypothetical protein [Actinoplanes lichenicola]